MKIAVVCGYLDSFEPLAKETVEVNKREYCRVWDYTLLVPRRVNPPWADPKSHAGGFSWSRMAFLLAMIQSRQWDWIWTVGADTLITDFSTSLESLINEFGEGKHLLICGECVAPIQADSFIMRASPESEDYLSDILSTWPTYKHHGWVENQSMIDRRYKWEHITQIVPQWRMNSYDYRRFEYLGAIYKSGNDCYGNRGQWKPGDFVIHWPAASLKERLDFLAYYKPLIEQ